MENKIKECVDYLKNNPKMIKIAAVIIVMVAAFLFFGMKGENEEIEIPVQEQTSETESVANEQSAEYVYIDICGEVENAGVYKVKSNARLFEVIEKAGGLTAKADLNAFNQAEKVTDGQKIVIPSKQARGNGESDTFFEHAENEASEGKININTAESEKLQEIKGVGPATADKIISYRKENGNFKSIEDIKNVSGIGEKTFEKMKDDITV